MDARRRTVLITLAKLAAVVVVIAGIVVSGFLVFREEGPPPWDDSVAAYVGAETIAEAEVEEVVADLRQAREQSYQERLEELPDDADPAERAALQAQLDGLEERLAFDHERVIEMQILTEAGTRYAEQAGLTVPEPDPDVVGEQLGLAPDLSYIQVAAEFVAVMDVLSGEVESAQPTVADQREIYDHMVSQGLSGVSFEQAQQVLTAELIGQPVGMRNLLTEVVAQADVRVNPRYELVFRVPVRLGEAETWLGVPLDG
ncbi:MAG TPA: hypothetical protein VKZ74_01225 [Natronosporangium sp.]|nr:hypothetical protein [Natronosporangium sp.]